MRPLCLRDRPLPLPRYDLDTDYRKCKEFLKGEGKGLILNRPRGYGKSYLAHRLCYEDPSSVLFKSPCRDKIYQRYRTVFGRVYFDSGTYIGGIYDNIIIDDTEDGFIDRLLTQNIYKRYIHLRTRREDGL
jgi:hypothetical protein